MKCYLEEFGLSRTSLHTNDLLPTNKPINKGLILRLYQEKSTWKQLYGWVEQLSGRNFTGCPLSTLHRHIIIAQKTKLTLGKCKARRIHLIAFLDSTFKFPESFDFAACTIPTVATNEEAPTASKTAPTTNEDAPTASKTAPTTNEDAQSTSNVTPTLYVQIEIRPSDSSGQSGAMGTMLKSTPPTHDTPCYEVKKKKPKGSQVNVLLRKRVKDQARCLQYQKRILMRQTKRLQRHRTKLKRLGRNERRLNSQNKRQEKIIEQLKKEKAKSSCRNCQVLASENCRLQQDLEGREQEISQSDVTHIIFDGYKYTDSLMECVWHLVDENVQNAHVKPVMKHVLELVGKTSTRLPNNSTVGYIINLRKQNVLNREKTVVREENTTRVLRHEHASQILYHDHSYPEGQA